MKRPENNIRGKSKSGVTVNAIGRLGNRQAKQIPNANPQIEARTTIPTRIKNFDATSWKPTKK